MSYRRQDLWPVLVDFFLHYSLAVLFWECHFLCSLASSCSFYKTDITKGAEGTNLSSKLSPSF